MNITGEMPDDLQIVYNPNCPINLLEFNGSMLSNEFKFTSDYLLFNDWARDYDPASNSLILSTDCSIFFDYVWHITQLPAINRILLINQILQPIRPVNDTDILTYENRLNSFNNLMMETGKDYSSFAKAGFYYIGVGDRFKCFSCSLVLEDWSRMDEPWEQHALYNPTCAYVLLKKGIHFLRETRIRFENGTVLLSELGLDNERAFFNGRSIPVTTRREIMEFENNDINPRRKTLFENHLHLYEERGSGTIPDFMQCKVCLTKEINVCVVPCGHAFACVDCIFSLWKCAMCNGSVDLVVKVSVYLSQNEHDDERSQLPCASRNVSEDNSCCKRCEKKEMDAIFLPCRHIYSCLECAKVYKECPACSSPICACLKVHLS